MKTLDRIVPSSIAIPMSSSDQAFAVRAAAASLLAAAVFALHGCAAIPVAAVAGAVLEAGGGAIVKTGTEYTRSGKVRRTFSNPIEDVHVALLEAFRRTDITIKTDERGKDGYRIAAEATQRKIDVKLLRLSDALTVFELNVKRNFLASDKATVSELLAQTEKVLDERAAPQYAAAAYVADDVRCTSVQAAPEPTQRPKHRRSKSRTRHCARR